MENFRNKRFVDLNKLAVEKKTLPFIQLPNDILCHKGLSDEACRTLGVLLTFKIGKNPTFPSLKAISILRGRTVNSISTHIKKLRELGIIYYKKRGYSMSNEYFFNFTVGCDNGFSKDSNIPTDNDSISKSTGTQTTSTLGLNNNKINIETNNSGGCSPDERQKQMDAIRNQHQWLKTKSNVTVKIK